MVKESGLSDLFSDCKDEKGLGGESIYHRFDNIYVLNLLAASLHTGTQYLKAEHLNGEEPEDLVVSRIHTINDPKIAHIYRLNLKLNVKRLLRNPFSKQDSKVAMGIVRFII